MIETTSVPPRKSSVILGNLRQSSGHVRQRSSSFRNNFGKSSEIVGKWSEIFGKSSLLVCLYNKQNITCPLVDIHIQARACNRPLALRGHVTNASLKQ